MAVGTKVSVDFQRLLSSTQNQLVIKPLLERYLLNAEFPDRFDVTFRKAGLARKPDNYFHPSTHPLWAARQLYYYLAEPDKILPEQIDVSSRMAITMGTAVHAFIEMCLRHAGTMIPLEGTCPACKRPHGTKKGQCDEYGAADEEIGSRGHMDGVVEIDLRGDLWKPGRGVFELKTTNANKARRLADLDLAAFKRLCPEYYAQVQEYMRMTGYTQALVVFVVLGFPWEIIEFQVPYDPMHALTISNKYRAVRDAVAEGVPPMACCGVGSTLSKQCFARTVCPVSLVGMP